MKENKKRENMIQDFDLGRFFDIASSNKIYVNKLNLHEIKNGILQDYIGDFELGGLKIIGSIDHKTNISLKKMDHFESYIDAIDVEYDSEDVTFTGYVYKINTFQFKKIMRFQYGKGVKYMQKIVVYHGQNC